jgi:predicted RND superfamily exporter protein
MNKKLLFQIIYSIIILGILLSIGVEFHLIIILGILFALIIFLKGKLYKKVRQFTDKRIPFLSKLPSWLHKTIIFLLVILIYILIKQTLFFLFKICGIDLQEILLENINHSLEESGKFYK